MNTGDFEDAHDAALAMEEALTRLSLAEQWKQQLGPAHDREEYVKQLREALRYLVREDV